MSKKNQKKIKKNLYDVELLEKTNEEYLQIFKKHVNEKREAFDNRINKDREEMDGNKSPKLVEAIEKEYTVVSDNISKIRIKNRKYIHKA